MDSSKNTQTNLDVLFTQKLIESSLDGVIIIDEKSLVTHWNNQAERIFGYSQQEAVGAQLHKLIMPDKYIEGHQKGISHYLNTGEHNILNKRIEIVGKRKNGEEFPIELTVSPIKTNNKMYFSAFVRDLTQQKQLTEQLKNAIKTLEDNERYLNSLNQFAAKILNQNTIDELVWEVTNMVIKEMGFEDCIIYLFDENREFLLQKAAFGPKQSDDKTILNPIKIRIGEGIVGTVGETGKSELISDTTKDPRYILDDEMRYSELTIPIITNGEIIGVIDSEHSQKNFYTNEHLEKLRTVSGLVSARINNIFNQDKLTVFSTAIEQNPISVIITNTEGLIEYVNPQFTKTTGYHIQDVKGRNPNILSSGKQQKDFYKKLWETILEGETWKGELCNKKKNGDLYWESVSISPIQNDEGKTTHYISVQEDISETKRINEELIAARQEAELASKAKSRFLANMSHEIRTPLMGIKGSVELLSNSELSGDQEVNLRRLETSTDGLISTINDILDFSKIESGLIELDHTPFSVYDVVHGVFQSMEAAADRKDLQLEFYFDDKLNGYYTGDPVRLRQILMNLTGNAIKFTQRGMIEINCASLETSESSSKIEFSVKDTGIGIDSKNINSIFESFKQEDESVNRNYGGTGLGLAISRQLVHLMGGDIHVQSAKGLGSKFYFELEFEKSEQQEVVAESTLGVDLSGIRLLLVEDNKLIQDTNKALIRRWGVIVEIADNGIEAIDRLKDAFYDVILMDKNMPKMDGFQATEMIRNDLKLTTPIIALTADVVKGVIDKCLASGMDDYISKPFHSSELKQKIFNLLPVEKRKYESASKPKLRKEAPLKLDKYDLSLLKKMTSDDEKQILNLVERFVESTLEYSDQLMLCNEEKNTEGVRLIAHSLKSSFLYFGLKTLLQSAKDLENKCNEGLEFSMLEDEIDFILAGIQPIIKQLKKDFGI